MKKQLTLLFFSLLLYSASAQLPNGSTAPNFTATDLNGQTYTLYDLLDQGKTVYLDFFATWCGPCWNYHNTHAFETIWNTYGPNGTDEAFCFQIEGDPATNTACIYGPSGCNNSTWGDWTDGVSYPTIDDASIRISYQVGYYPTIYMVCPSSKKVYEVGQLGAGGLWNARTTYCSPPPLTVSLNNVQNVTCKGLSNGVVDIQPAGGIPPYTYNWSNGAKTPDLVGAPAGSYSCTVTASNSVTATIGPIDVEEPAEAVNVQLVETTPVGCNGFAGSITVSASGGWSNSYDYDWSHNQSGPSVFVNTAGNYKVTVSDINNCTKTLTVPMAAPEHPTVSIVPPPVITCLAPMVEIDASGSSSGPNYTFAWQASNGGHIVSGENTPMPLVDAAGNYTLFVTNTDNNCTSFGSTITTASVDNPIAEAGPNGLLNCILPIDTLEGSASQGPEFKYLWTGPGITSGDSTLHPVVNKGGQYVLKVTNNANGCVKLDTAMVTADTLQPVVMIETPEHLNCHNDTLTLSTNGSSHGPNFEYNWSGPGGFSSQAENPEVFAGGDYQLVVDNTTNGCSKADTMSVLHFATPAVSIDSVIAITCFGASNGGAIAAATGGFGNKMYLWNTGDTTNTINNLEAGLYSVTVTDEDACTATVNLDLDQPDVLAVDAQSTHETGFNTQDGTASASATGGTAPYEFIWSNGFAGQNQTGLVPGAYTVTTTDSYGCSNQKTVNVNAYNCTLAVALAEQNSSCFGANNGSLSVAVNGGTGPFAYLWSTGDTTATIDNLAPGTYTVTTTDAAGCPSVSDGQVTQPPLLQISAANVQHPVCPDEAGGSVGVTAGGGTTPYNYAWSNGANTASIDQLLPGQYILTLTDGNGCSHTANYSISPTDDEKPVVSAKDVTVALDASGHYTLNLADVQGEFTDNCAVSSWSFVPSADLNCAHVGAATVELRAVDQKGNAGSKSILVTVVDNTPPVATCPDNMTVQACSETAEVNFPAPMATDACTAPGEMQVEQTSGLPSASAFPVGETKQEFMFTDKNGNTANCGFTITVLEPVSVTGVTTTPATVGQSNGSVAVVITGGTPPYTFVWTRNGEQVGFEQNLENVPAGFYVLQITDANGCVIATETIEVGSVVSALEPAWARQMSLFPNPSTGLTSVQFSVRLTGELNLTVTDELGRLVWTNKLEGTQQALIDLTDAPEGMYYLRLFYENEQVTRVFTIQR